MSFKIEQHAKDIAEQAAKQLIKKIGGDWKVQVWENGGLYHARVSFKAISISIHNYSHMKEKGKLYFYTALINDDGKHPGTGAGHLSHDSKGYDIVKVAKDAIETAVAELKVYEKYVIEETYNMLKLC